MESQIRDPLKVIYSSSYDRGLEHLLGIWSEVKKVVKVKCDKEPELHVFYGWNLFDAIHFNNPSSMAWKVKIEEKMKEKEIFHHGRVSHEELIINFKTSSVFAYPTHFGEISCQVAMMAQAYGCIPVVMNYAALKETVKFGDRIDGDIYDPETKEKYKTALIHRLVWAFKKPEDAEIMRKEMINWAQNEFTWEKVAKDWNKNILNV